MVLMMVLEAVLVFLGRALMVLELMLVFLDRFLVVLEVTGSPLTGSHRHVADTRRIHVFHRSTIDSALLPFPNCPKV